MIRKLKVSRDRHIAKRLVIRLIAALLQLSPQIAILFCAPGVDCDIFVCCRRCSPAFGEDRVEAEEGHGAMLSEGREGGREGDGEDELERGE